MSDRKTKNSVKIKMTADDISQAIGEWLYHEKKLPTGMEEGMVNFKDKRVVSFESPHYD